MFEYKRIITDEEQKMLEHDLFDIKDWIDKAIDGKVNNCMKRAAGECRQIMKQFPDAMIPANDRIAALALFSSKHYKNRLQREEELVSKQQSIESTTIDTGHTEVLGTTEDSESK